ncbi:LPS assembly lipoprotein LptE [Sulfurimonas sp.]|uniref:LPS assembly lipoprotein LptE n=1 Tax=Sulfurimonas sp. TaxID=2022749 RepID=UPI00262E1BF7|nr:LPS assembly lipoprotein LptE [Sulfurimonas sp.]
MHFYPHFYKFIVLSVVVVLLNACGYRPSSKYAREVLGNRISTDVVISSQDPENTVVIKDGVDAALVEIFHTSLTSLKYADTHLKIALNPPSYAPIQYNADGFVIAYRATITLRITRESKNIKKHYMSRGTYDFAVSPNAVLTDQERFNAIKFGSAKAISSFIAQVSAEGSRIEK